jgi:hypothetical protein
MEQAEIYFRSLDRAVARENFLEKEMLDSDVHHLEVRGQFFDKIAVLAAGSLAVGISFMVAGFEHPSVQSTLQQHLLGLSFAMSFLLLSLIGCVLHNFRISDAVHLLTSQLECVYKSANLLRTWREIHPNEPLTTNHSQSSKIEEYDDKAKLFEVCKKNSLRITSVIGVIALSCMIAGYALGLEQTVSIFAKASASQPVVTSPHLH